MIVKFFLVCLLACSFVAAAPPVLTKCNVSDSNCIKSSAQAFVQTFIAGNPEWGMEPLEPFYMKSLDASSDSLKLYLKDVTGKGLDKCQIKKIRFDQLKSKLSLKAECSVEIDGQYDIDGQLFVLPIQGKGPAHVVLRKVVISAAADIAEVTGKDNYQHWSIKRYSHSYELKDKATIELQNLFNGNELLGRAVKDLIASDPNEVVNELGPPIVKAVVDKIVVAINNFFKKVPLDDLILN